MCEGSSNVTIIANKFAIIARETQKSSQALQGIWLRPILRRCLGCGSHMVASKEVLGGLPISWEACEIITTGRDEVGIALSS